MFKYCTENNSLKSRNSGFKPKDSAVNRLVELVHNVESGLNDKEDKGIVFLDISKAFNKIWHEGLLFILKQIGIDMSLLIWFQSYLSDLTQYVVLNGSASSSEPVMAGVHQGSILGPIFFLIYINDITENNESDRIIIKSTINNDIIQIGTWSNQWLVTFSKINVNLCLSQIRNVHKQIYKLHSIIYY